MKNLAKLALVATLFLSFLSVGFGIQSASAIGTVECDPFINPGLDDPNYPRDQVPQFFDADQQNSADHNLAGYAYYTQGQAASPNYRFDSINWQGTPSYSVTPALPNGLTLNTSTGEITGSPTAAQSEMTYTIYATGTASTNAQYCIGWEFNLTVWASGGGGGGGGGSSPNYVDFSLGSYSFFHSGDSFSTLAEGADVPAYTVNMGSYSDGVAVQQLSILMGDDPRSGPPEVSWNIPGAVDANGASYVTWNPAGENCGIADIRIGGDSQNAGSGITCLKATNNAGSVHWLAIMFSTPTAQDISVDVEDGTFVVDGAGNHNFFAGLFNATDSSTVYRASILEPFDESSSNGGSEPDVSASFAFPVSPGERIFGQDVTITAENLQLSTDYSVVLRSTPQILASGRTVSSSFNTSVTIPDNLEAGWHSITFNATRSDGAAISEAVYFKINANGILLETTTSQPAELAFTPAPPVQYWFWAMLILALGLGAYVYGREFNPEFMRVMSLVRNESGELIFVKRRIRSEDL